MDEPIQISGYRQLIDGQVNEFISVSRPFGEPMIPLANMVKKAFDIQLNFIKSTVAQPCPDDSTFKKMIEPLAAVIREIQEFRDRNRHVDDFFNHLSTVSESIVALSWIGVKPAPVQFVRDMRDAGDYFGNRVLSTHKGNQQHQTWINKWHEVLKGLEQYVKEYHLTGVTWGAGLKGKAVAPGSIGGPGAMPPPPPPPPTMDLTAGGDNRQTLLKELNQGVDIVRMLKPVSREQSSQSQHATSTTGSSLRQAAAAERTYPPKFALDGRKWRVEHQKDNYDLKIENAEMSHSIAMFKCQNVGLRVENKINGSTIDNCKRTTVVLKDCISSVELIRCQHVKLQCSGHVPLISIDNCDSIEIYLTQESRDAEVISSKSSSLNICLLKPDGDFTEMAVPEQIKTVVVNGKLVSTVVEKI